VGRPLSVHWDCLGHTAYGTRARFALMVWTSLLPLLGGKCTKGVPFGFCVGDGRALDVLENVLQCFSPLLGRQVLWTMKPGYWSNGCRVLTNLGKVNSKFINLVVS
jgi:hypothetical protein